MACIDSSLEIAEAVVITHDPASRLYALCAGWQGIEMRGGFATLRDAVRAADPGGLRLWEDPSAATDREIPPDAVLFSRAKRTPSGAPSAARGLMPETFAR
jgi:hypothetical protein